MTNKYLYFKAKHIYKKKLIWFRIWRTTSSHDLEEWSWEHIYKILPKCSKTTKYETHGTLIDGLMNDDLKISKPLSKKEELLCKLLYE